MTGKVQMLLLAASLLFSGTAAAGSTLDDAKVCNVSIGKAIATLDPQPTYRLKGAIGSQKRTINYKLYQGDAQYSFKCIIKRGEVQEIRWPNNFLAVLAAQSQRGTESEVASIVN